MSLHEQQNFLAKLYTDEQFRRAFLSEPEKIGKENYLSESEISEITEMLPEEISFFAESLFWKRLREVEKILPLTRIILSEDFQKFFRQFSQNYNPQTVKKHLEDAIEFCNFLLESDFVSEVPKNTARYEQSKLKFYGCGKRFVVCKLSCDVREIGKQITANSGFNLERKTKIAVWLRFGKKIKHFFL